MSLVVRFEVDACIGTVPEVKPKPRQSNLNDDIDEISNLLTKVSLKKTTQQHHPLSNADLRIRKGGKYVPQDSVVEMTTRSERNATQFDWDDAFPQLFLSHTTNHLMGVHTNGRFSRIVKRKLDSEEMKRIRREMRPAFMKLKAVLEAIQETVVLYGNQGRLTLLCQNGVLKVYKRINRDSCLPREVLERFCA